MKVPGFSAESALYASDATYHLRTYQTEAWNVGPVLLPQQRNADLSLYCQLACSWCAWWHDEDWCDVCYSPRCRGGSSVSGGGDMPVFLTR